MRLIPVIDVLHGVVVRGIAGRRSEYRPIVSKLTSSTNPVEVARALIDAVQPRELYLADLDAIQGSSLANDVYRQIYALGVDVWVDAGTADRAGALQIADSGCHVVAGLETVPGQEVLREIIDAIGSSRVVFSLDLRDGKPLRDWHLSPQPPHLGAKGEAERITARAVECGITRMIVLDLARVGIGEGTGTDELCRWIASTYPHVEVIAGGGISTPTDVARLESFGVRGVLVASALHSGSLLVRGSQ